MVMSTDPNEIQLPVSGRIGYVQEWDPQTGVWDGWIEWSGSTTDELICNGGSRDWAVYMVIRRYQEHLTDGLTAAAYAMRTVEERRAFSEKVSRVLECNTAMGEALKGHFAGLLKVSARTEREAKG
jgi:hypothetical protein